MRLTPFFDSGARRITKSWRFTKPRVEWQSTSRLHARSFTNAAFTSSCPRAPFPSPTSSLASGMALFASCVGLSKLLVVIFPCSLHDVPRRHGQLEPLVHASEAAADRLPDAPDCLPQQKCSSMRVAHELAWRVVRPSMALPPPTSRIAGHVRCRSSLSATGKSNVNFET